MTKNHSASCLLSNANHGRQEALVYVLEVGSVSKHLHEVNCQASLKTPCKLPNLSYAEFEDRKKIIHNYKTRKVITWGFWIS